MKKMVVKNVFLQGDKMDNNRLLTIITDIIQSAQAKKHVGID